MAAIERSAQIYPSSRSRFETPNDGILNPPQPHPDLLERTDPIEDSTSFFEQLCCSSMEGAHVQVQGLEGFQNLVPSVVVAADRRGQAFGDRTARAPGLPRILVP